RRRQHVVPGGHVDPVGRPVLPGASLRAGRGRFEPAARETPSGDDGAGMMSSDFQMAGGYDAALAAQPPRSGSGHPVPMVLAEAVHKSFGHVEVLKGIDMTVMPGQVAVLLGPSGSGKTTFLRCINHLEKINGGRLSVDGTLVGYRQRGEKLYELRDKEVAARRREIGMVFQSF